MGNAGIYKAVVTDNSLFFKTGTIKVRVQNLYNDDISWNLVDNYDKNTFREDVFFDTDALVFTPIGGGGAGIFSIPQINTTGVVQFLNGNMTQAMWMGSYLVPEKDNDGNLVKINIPNDQPLFEGAGADGIRQNASGFVEKTIKGDHGTFIFRTKKTNPPGNDTKPDNMDFNKNRSTNLIVLDDDNFKITHFSKWVDKDNKNGATLKQYEEILLTTENGLPVVKLSVFDEDKRSKSNVLVSVNSTTLNFDDTAKKIRSKVGVDKRGVTMTSSDYRKRKMTTMMQQPDLVSFNNGKVDFVIDDNEVVISVPNGKVRLSGKEVLLGDGGGYIVTKDSPLPMRMEDGTILKASKCKA